MAAPIILCDCAGMDEKRWLECREHGPKGDIEYTVGGSDVATIFGLSPWTTPLELWMIKKGRMKPKDKPNPLQLQMGHMLEPIAAHFYAQRTGDTVIDDTNMYQHADFPYNMQFVGPGWMNKMGRWEAPYELLKVSYDDGCAYYGQLKKEGKLIDMTMAEFADYYREKKRYTEPECALWRDLIYGSDKQLFWYCDPYMRACVNMDQGGAIVDLRPYAAKLEWDIGIGTPHVQEAGYPYLIQEKYRAGYFTHYAGEGTIRSAKLCHNGEEVDLALCRTHARFSQEGECRKLTLDPVEVVFSDVTVKLQTVLTFREGSSEIKVERNILEMSDPEAEVTINEYMVACYGTTEYPEDMTGLHLSVRKGTVEYGLDYAYKCREQFLEGAEETVCVIPPIKTRVSLECEGRDKAGYYKEGYAFSPMFTLGYTGTVKEKEVFTTWLKLARAD